MSHGVGPSLLCDLIQNPRWGPGYNAIGLTAAVVVTYSNGGPGTSSLRPPLFRFFCCGSTAFWGMLFMLRFADLVR